jgi:hypothetical protein
MSYVVAAVVVVFVLCALDLLLTLGVVRRLREHSELLGQLTSQERPAPQATLPVGATVGQFAATTIDGKPLSRDTLLAPAVVGLFSASCEPCEEQLPRFLEYAASMRGGSDRVLAIVVGKGEDANETARRLAPVARVVVEDPFGPVAAAFGASLFPAVYLVDTDYVVAASATELDALPAPDAVWTDSPAAAAER